MDTIVNYRRVIEEILNEYASIRKSLTPGVQAQRVVDSVNDHYQLLSVGWHNNRFVYTVLFHFDIIDGRVWIQQNNTDALIADELIRRGVAEEDIVLGFLPAEARPHVRLAKA